MANRILLADDSITIQKVVNLTFADEGIEVVAVSNGDQAERRLADVQPDLVLADIFMPGKNGYELCEAIKNNPPFQHIPVILLVGAFEPFDQAEAHRVKADAHLTKPFESRTLVDTVRRLIGASSKPRTGPLPSAGVNAAPVEPLTPPPIAAPPVAAPPIVVPPVEARPSAQLSQPFNLDLPTMASPAAPPAAGATIPLNYAFESNEALRAAEPIEVQVAEAPDEAAFAEGHLPHRTNDLSFANNEAPFEAFGLEDLFAEPQSSPSPASLAASQPDSILAETGQESSTGVPSTFGYETEEMLLDFDQPVPAMTRPAREPFAFDLDVREPASVDASGIQTDELTEATAEDRSEPEVLKTTLLTMPTPTAPVESAIDTNPLEMPAAPTADHADVAVTMTGPAIDESALLNLDDPLGDVLDEGLAEGTAGAVASDAAQVEAVASQASPVDVTIPAVPADFEVEMPAEPLAAPVVSETVAPPVEAAVSETGFGFEPVEEQEPAEPQPVAEARFTTSSMWTDEEARFAAIDIEATPVDEPAEAAAPPPVEAAGSFRFSDDASAFNTRPEPVVETAAPAVEAAATPVAEDTAAPPPAPVAANTVELSPALMDEIVRRVVAQLSDSVVREIAWEVVPDCVERVIKEVTAQEVAKR
ncbi:MAG TPA: response regulator [Blastocatellia bacterium]|nr:response regulator [Blastocatellia bacterium]